MSAAKVVHALAPDICKHLHAGLLLLGLTEATTSTIRAVAVPLLVVRHTVTVPLSSFTV